MNRQDKQAHDNQIDETAELIAAYALGALEPEERAQVEAMVVNDPAARRQLDEALESAALLAFASEMRTPSPDLKARILQAAALTPPMPVTEMPLAERVPGRMVLAPASRRSSFWQELLDTVTGRLSLATGSLAVVFLLISGILFNNLVQTQAQLAVVQRQVGEQQNLVRILSDPNHVQQKLVTANNATGSGDVYYNPGDQQVLVVVRGMQPLPETEAYQLWLIKGNEAPVPLPTFTVDQEGRALAFVAAPSNVGGYNAIAITREARTGSAKPTSPVLMSGKLS